MRAGATADDAEAASDGADAGDAAADEAASAGAAAADLPPWCVDWAALSQFKAMML